MRLAAPMLFIIILHLQTATAADETLFSLEHIFANKLRLALELSWEVNQRTMPTNMAQVIPSLTLEWWTMMEEKFQEFDRQAGFSNSIFEKYVFLPPGVRFSIGPSVAEAMLMNAQPIRSTGGGSNRWIIYRIGEAIDPVLLDEKRVQEMLRKAGVQVPSPLYMPSAIELDAPRREEEARNQQEMEEDLKRYVATLENKPVPRPPRVVFSPPSDSNSTNQNEAPEEGGDAGSRFKYFGAAAALLFGVVVAVFAFRQAKGRN